MSDQNGSLADIVYNTMLDTILACYEAERAGMKVQAYRSMDRGLEMSGVSVTLGRFSIVSVRSPGAIAGAVATAKAMRRIAKIEEYAQGNEKLRDALDRIPPAWNVVSIIEYCRQSGIDLAELVDKTSLYDWVLKTFETGDLPVTDILKKK